MSEIQNQLINFLLGTASPTSNELKITHVSFHSKDPNYSNLDSDTLSSEDTEFDRVAISFTRDTSQTNKLKASVNLTSSTAVCPTTTISSKTSNTVYVLTSATNFKLYDLVELQDNSGAYIEATIIGLSGSTITLNKAINSSSGKIIRRQISKIALICDGTSTRNSGKVFKWYAYRKYKSSGMAYPIYLSNIISLT